MYDELDIIYKSNWIIFIGKYANNSLVANNLFACEFYFVFIFVFLHLDCYHQNHMIDECKNHGLGDIK